MLTPTGPQTAKAAVYLTFKSRFNVFARVVAERVGSVWVFALAVVLVALWFIGGFIGGFSDSYQLLMNTGTTIITFLMVFLIQNTTSRETKAINLKLDELTLAVREAKNKVVAVEHKDDTVVAEIEAEHDARVQSTT